MPIARPSMILRSAFPVRSIAARLQFFAFVLSGASCARPNIARFWSSFQRSFRALREIVSLSIFHGVRNMDKLVAAVALAVALPGIAHAQSAPLEKPKMACCEKMKEKCACCDKMAVKPASGADTSSSDPHAGHDMKPAAPADAHSND